MAIPSEITALIDKTEAEIQEAGEDLATKLGRVLETKTTVINIKNRLENLQ